MSACREMSLVECEKLIASSKGALRADHSPRLEFVSFDTKRGTAFAYLDSKRNEAIVLSFAQFASKKGLSAIEVWLDGHARLMAA